MLYWIFRIWTFNVCVTCDTCVKASHWCPLRHVTRDCPKPLIINLLLCCKLKGLCDVSVTFYMRVERRPVNMAVDVIVFAEVWTSRLFRQICACFCGWHTKRKNKSSFTKKNIHIYVFLWLILGSASSIHRRSHRDVYRGVLGIGSYPEVEAQRNVWRCCICNVQNQTGGNRSTPIFICEIYPEASSWAASGEFMSSTQQKQISLPDTLPPADSFPHRRASVW